MLIASNFCNYKSSCYKHSCTDFVWTKVFNSLGYMPRSTIAGSYSKCMFSFVENVPSIFQSVYHLVCPPEMNKDSSCFTSTIAFGNVSILDFSHSNRCVVLSHCFNLRFHNNTMMLSFFLYAYLLSAYILWWGVSSDHLPLFALDCFLLKNSLCIFGYVFYQICTFYKYHSPVCDVFFILLKALAEQEFLSLRSTWSPNWGSTRFSPMLFSRSCIILHLGSWLILS